MFSFSTAGPKRWHRPLFLIVSALVVVAVIISAHAVMLPFVMAALIAYVLTPAVAWFEKHRVPRAAAILGVYAFVLGSVFLFFRLSAPRLGHELRGLQSEIPALRVRFEEEWVPWVAQKLSVIGVTIDTEPGALTGKLRAYVQHNSGEIARFGTNLLTSVSHGVFLFFITLMLAAYLMMTRERIFTFIRTLVRPSARPSFEALVARMDRGLSGVVRGQIIICLINGVLSAIGFGIVGLKYWPILALVAAVLSIIPIFGSIVSTIPVVAIGLTQGVGTAVFVLFWIIGIHQLEANFLNPKIMGDAAKIHPVLVVFSLLAGEHMFGATGALLAVPCMSMARSLFLHFQHVANASDPELATETVPGGESMTPPK